MNDVIEVEVNLMASKKGKYRFEAKRVKQEAQPSTSHSTLDAKIDSVLRVMERMMERFVENDRQVVREYNELQIRHPNFRQPRHLGLPPPQIIKRGKRNQNHNETDQVSF